MLTKEGVLFGKNTKMLCCEFSKTLENQLGDKTFDEKAIFTWMVKFSFYETHNRGKTYLLKTELTSRNLPGDPAARPKLALGPKRWRAGLLLLLLLLLLLVYCAASCRCCTGLPRGTTGPPEQGAHCPYSPAQDKDPIFYLGPTAHLDLEVSWSPWRHIFIFIASDGTQNKIISWMEAPHGIVGQRRNCGKFQ